MLKWLPAAIAMVIDKIPLERLLVKPPSNKERLKELAAILEGSHAKPAGAKAEEPALVLGEATEESHPANLGNLRPKVHLESNPSVTSAVSTKETVDYQNREIGKILLTMQRHCVQKFRINGKACDCGQSRHLLDLEALVEEAIGMVDNPTIYYQILDWVGRLGPISTVENVSSGKYDDAYPVFSNEARDFRKDLLGTLDPKALFPPREETPAEIREEVLEAK